MNNLVLSFYDRRAKPNSKPFVIVEGQIFHSDLASKSDFWWWSIPKFPGTLWIIDALFNSRTQDNKCNRILIIFLLRLYKELCLSSVDVKLGTTKKKEELHNVFPSLTGMLWLGVIWILSSTYRLSETKQHLQSLLPVEAPLQSMEPISKTLDILQLLTGNQHLCIESWSNISMLRLPAAHWKKSFYSSASFQRGQLSTYG